MLETNKIYLGDCYDLIKQIPDKSIDLIYTDIPYEFISGGASRKEFGKKIKKAKYKHPTIKPLELVKKHILHTTNENDIVLDAFLGSGTTAKACQETNRQYIGFEINEEYYKIAVDRLNNINARGEVSIF